MSVWKSWRLTLYSPKINSLSKKGYKTKYPAFDTNGNGRYSLLSFPRREGEKILPRFMIETAAAIFVIGFLSHFPFHSDEHPPSPPLLLVEKPLLWRMSWPLPIEVVGRWLLEGLWSQISASPPVYPGASAPPRISNFFLSKYWQLPVMLYNIEVERLFCPNNPSWLWVLVPSAKVFFFATQLSSSPRIVLSPQYNFKFIEGPNIF